MEQNKKQAVQLILLFGLVSFFGDIIYQGARSVNGPYLKTLGASAALVGFIAGLGEFLGYGIRLLSGYFSDKTKAYWLFYFIGYAMLAAVPLLALAGVWQVAALFIVIERIGKALRTPARDTILSHATKRIGTGLGFGINKFMDQIGGVAGPLIFSGLFFIAGTQSQTLADYQKGYVLFWLPFIALIFCGIFVYRRFPDPQSLEAPSNRPEPDKLSDIFWLYTLFTFVTAMGFVNFVLMGYHYKANNILSDAQIPFFYAIAMAIEAFAAILIGRTYDWFKEKYQNNHAGLLVLGLIPIFSVLIVFTGFTRSIILIVFSVVLWGIVMGAHETVMKSAIADLTPLKKRGTGYGIFNTVYGLAIFIGSVLMGMLYDKYLSGLLFFTLLLQAAGIVIFFIILRRMKISSFQGA